MKHIYQFLCSAGWIFVEGVFSSFSTQATTQQPATPSLLSFLGQQIDVLEEFNAQQNIKAVPLQYLGSDPSLYDRTIQVPSGCPPEAFSLLAIYDTEIALRRSERERFLHLADFLYERLVRKGDDLSVFASSAQETDLLSMIRSHAACLMQKAGHRPLEHSSGDIQTRWNIRLRIAETINDLSFHQRVQEILTIQDDLEHIVSFFAHHMAEFQANPEQWMALHKNDGDLIKAAQIVKEAAHFRQLQLQNTDVDVFFESLKSQYQERLDTLWMDTPLAEKISREARQAREMVFPLVQSMYKFEIDKFINYLENLTQVLQKTRNIYAVECGASDRRTSNTCGLNSLLIKDAVRGNVQSLRADSCSLIEALSRSSKAVQQGLNTALSQDPGRPHPLTLSVLAGQSIQFESAGTSGFIAGQKVRRPAEDWLLNYKGRTVVQPGAVQSDLLELVSYAYDYNLIVLTRTSQGSPLPQAQFVRERSGTVQNTVAALPNPVPALPVAKLSPAVFSTRRQSQIHRLNTSLATLKKPVTSSPQGAQTLPLQKASAIRRESFTSNTGLTGAAAHVSSNHLSPRASLSNVSLLSCIQSISIFSAYQEIRFLIHTPGHYQAAEFYAPLPQSLHYGRPTEWYQRKVKNMIQRTK